MLDLWFVDDWDDARQEPIGFGMCLHRHLLPEDALALAEAYERVANARFGRGEAVILNQAGERVSIEELSRLHEEELVAGG